MSFQEKSAWGLLAGLALVSVFYFPAAFSVVESTRASSSAGGLGLIGLIAVGTIALVAIEIAYHSIVAAWAPREAGRTDERDRLIDLKAERNGSLALGLALFWLIGWILVRSILSPEADVSPLAIAVFIMLAITASEIAKLSSQIWYYRIGA